MILKFKSAQGVRDVLDRVLDGMRVVIHRIDAPLVTCVVMGHVRYSVEDRIPHVHVGTGHVDLRTKGLLPVSELAVLHFCEQIEVFFNTSVSVRVVPAGFFKSTAVFSHLLRRQVGDVSFPFFDELHRDLIHLIEIIGGKKEPVLIIGSEPRDVLFDGLHKLALLFGGICIVKAEVEFAAVFLRHAVVKKYALGMSNMQITVGLGGKTGVDGIIHALSEILVYFLLNKMAAHLFLCGNRCVISFQFFFTHNCS